MPQIRTLLPSTWWPTSARNIFKTRRCFPHLNLLRKYDLQVRRYRFYNLDEQKLNVKQLNTRILQGLSLEQRLLILAPF